MRAKRFLRQHEPLSPLIALIVIVVLIVAIGAFVWLTYNRLVALRLACENSWSQIDVALKLRHDLIPTLVAAVSGYAGHEAQTLAQVTELRSDAVASDGSGPAQRGTAEARLGGGVNRMLLLAEDYPELRATENFQKLQTELSDVEEKISITRRVYNDTVETLQHEDPGLPVGPDRERLQLRAARVLRGRRRCRDCADGLARWCPRWNGRRARMSAGRLIWGVLWRFLVAGIVFTILAVLPSIFIPEDGGPQKAFEITDGNTRVELHRRRQPPHHREAPLRVLRRQLLGRLPGHPVRAGARISNVSVAEGGKAYRPGANTELGSFDRPDSFGTTETPDYPGVRVVWHYDKTKDPKTFTLSYDVDGAVTAYDDVIDVGWDVWGAQWTFWLNNLSAQIVTPDGSDPTDAWVSTFDAPDPGAIATGQPAGTRELGAEPDIGGGRGELLGRAGCRGPRRPLQGARAPGRGQLRQRRPCRARATAPTSSPPTRTRSRRPS